MFQLKIKFTILFVLINAFFPPLSYSANQSYVIVNLLGQLGNQMFQIAAGYSLALDNHANFFVPGFYEIRDWNTQTNYKYVFSKINPFLPEQSEQFHYKEKDFTYSPIPYHPNMSISGYFQSEKYFAHNKNEIIKLFEPQPDVVKYLKKKYKKILHHPNSVSIHVRTYHGLSSTVFPLNGKEYVEKALSLFSEDALFVVFSDHIEWCKQNLSGLRTKILFIEEEPYYIDFYLMSMCKHNIISNSSFSWWAAYLNRNPNKVVIAPKKWFQPEIGIDTRDLIPKEWIQLE